MLTSPCSFLEQRLGVTSLLGEVLGFLCLPLGAAKETLEKVHGGKGFVSDGNERMLGGGEEREVMIGRGNSMSGGGDIRMPEVTKDKQTNKRG